LREGDERRHLMREREGGRRIYIEAGIKSEEVEAKV
jgi:hypothetical protein